MKVYQKFIAALVLIFSGLAFVPYVEANFSGSGIWQQFADAYRPRITAENMSFVSALNLQSERIAIDDHYLYSTFNNLSVIDAGDPSHLKVVNKFPTNYVYDLALSGQYVFAGQQDFGLRAFDVSVGLPTVFSSSKMAESALGLDLMDGILYVANGRSGLILIDAARPADLPILSQVETGGMALDVASDGKFAYVANGLAGLKVFDVADKAHPVEVANLKTPGAPVDASLSGSTLFLAEGAAGLEIYDVSTPSAPRQLSRFNTSGLVEKAFLQDHFAYLADRESGILVLDVADPANPVKVASYDTMGGGWDVAVRDGYVYVADFPYGVQVLRFIPPVKSDVPTGGGVFTAPADGIQYTFPAGTFLRPTTLNHQPLSGNGVPPSSLLYPKVGPFFIDTGKDANGNASAPRQAYDISVPYSDDGLTPDQEKALGLYTWDGRQWVLAATSKVDADANVVTARLFEWSLGGILMDKVNEPAGK